MENNCRLIDAFAVLKHFDGYGFGQECDAEIILDYIAEGAPTVDTVEVVRCEDCENNGACSIQDAMNWTPGPEIGDYFCSFAKRKE